MPRYYFRITDSLNTEMKKEGLELPDRQAAWTEAAAACGELLKDLNGGLQPGEKWKMLVRDETGQDIYELEFRTREF